MKRTKSAMFDDDVVDALCHNGQSFTIEDVIKAWQEGKIPRHLARRAISQSLAALCSLPVSAGGWDHRHGIQVLHNIVAKYPDIYKED